MRMKRVLAAVLVAATVAATPLSLHPAASAARLSAFSDLTDPTTAEAAEFLRLMGVVNGVPGGSYNPSGTLSRAEFCKMSVSALNRAEEEPAQRGRTIYLDVGPSHWARGYINLASTITLGAGSDGKGGTALVAGLGDGTFRPDRPITYGEAVTILCRVLGYGVSDVATGGAWYDGYLSAAASVGLTDGLTLSGTDVINRGQAAVLFYNLYFSKSKGSDKTYLVAQGGSEVEGGVVLSTDATADDGSTGAVSTTKSTYKTDRVFDPAIEGQEGKLLLDADGKLLAFQPKKGTSQRAANIQSTEATYLTISGGEKLDVEPTTVVYQNGEAKTWKDVYLNLSPSTSVTFHYGANGKLAYLFFPSESADGPDTMVLRTAPGTGTNPFSAMTGSGNYTMFKNGVAATASDLRQYDVATFDSSTRLIQVSDLKLTGAYENVSPSPSAPITITVMGHTFPVLSSARNDLSSFKIGDRITLLLTADNRVAGVVPANTVRGEALGVASVSSDGQATVKLIQGGLTVSGSVSKSTVSQYHNQLVTVTSGSTGTLSLSVVSGSNAKGALDVAARKLGDKPVADNVAVYDRVKDGAVVAVKYSDLTAPSIPPSKISFVSYDYAGRVRYLVLNDATGDAYTYGYFSYTRAEENEEGDVVRPAQLCVRMADSKGAETRSAQGGFLGTVRSDAAGGVAYAADGRISATVLLQSLPGIKRSAFDPEAMTVTVAGIAYPISEQVQCYNKATKTWFTPGKEGMESARAYSDNLTLYYDRTPENGGKIRLIVVD